MGGLGNGSTADAWRSSGSLVGYAGGLERKRELLRHEGALES